LPSQRPEDVAFLALFDDESDDNGDGLSVTEFAGRMAELATDYQEL
jgi:hypothetical protein